MKNILFHYPDLDKNRFFTPDCFGFNDPFIYLKQKLFSLGYNLITSDDHPLGEDCAWVIFYNIPSSRLLKQKKTLIKKLRGIIQRSKMGRESGRDLYDECVEKDFKNIALILMENDVICPGNFSKELHNKFPLIFTWDDSYVDNAKFIKMDFPIAREMPPIDKIDFKNKKLLVNISRNRYSSHPNDLYKARRKTIRHFEKKFPLEFDLFGIGWNSPVGRWQKIFPFLTPKYSSYRGPIKTKAEILCKYKFALCYENLKGLNGYTTEKIFDAMRCNTVPIYWGAKNVEEYVDPAAFIDRRKFASDAELAKFISTMTETEYNRHLAAINNYLKSERFSLFLPENFANNVIKNLKL